MNEEEAAIVREIFATYAKGQVGLNQITRGLVCTMIEEIMLDPEKLKGCMDFFKGTTRATHLKLTQDCS